METQYQRSIRYQKIAGTYSRNLEIKEYYGGSDWTLRQIGEMFGLSRQRIYQIANNPFDTKPVESSQVTLSQKISQVIKKVMSWFRR